MELPKTQEELDALIQERVTAETEKFADYDSLKEQAGKAAGFESKITELESSKTELTGKLDKIEQDKQRADLVAGVAKDKGVPADALRGSTKEELEAHADQLKEFMEQTAPVILGQAETPGKTATDPMRGFAKKLFENAK